MKRRKKHQHVNPDDLQPKIAAGLTQGASAREALEEFPVDPRPSGIEVVRNFSEAVARSERDPRDRSTHAIIRLDTTTAVVEPNTGRKMIDVNIILPPAHKRQILTGYRCISCLEPFDTAYPARCDVCGYEVRDRQAQRAEQEFEGEVFVGPSKPIRKILVERELKQEKRRFDREIAEGKSPMRGLRHAS